MTVFCRRAWAVALTTLVTATSMQLVVGPALGADTPLEGAALPALMQPVPGGEEIASASSQFVLHTRAQYSELNPKTTYSVVRVSDGQTVRVFRSAGAETTALEPRLIATSLVQLVEPDDIQRRVEVRDAATGSLQRIIDTTGSALLHADLTWAMVNNVGADTGQNTVRFVRADGSFSTVSGNFQQPPQWLGGDTDTAYVSTFGADYAIDVDTGRRTELVFPDQARLSAVTPTHLIAQGSASGSRSFRTLTRSGLRPGWSVDVPTDYHDRGFLPYGEGLAQLHLPDDAPSGRYLALRPVDLATGSLQAPVTDGIAQAVPLTDGRTALVLTDTPGGRIVVATGTGGAVVPVADLPDVGEGALDLGFSGERVVASWSGRTDIWSIPADGSQAWSSANTDPGFTANDQDKNISYAGDVTMTENDTVNRNATRYRLMWPGGSRDVLGDVALLGHGGKYVERVDYRPSGGLVEVSDVRTGAVAASYPGYDVRPIEGSRIWSQPNSAAVIQGTDLEGRDPAAQAQLPGRCASGRLDDVRGRWALVRCGNETLAVDLRGALPTHTVPAHARGSVLGGGFIASVFAEASAASDPLYVEVTELATEQSRTYGPVRGQSFPPGVALAANDNRSPELVYADPASQVRRITLEWMTTDGRGPYLTGSPQVPAAVSSTAPHEVSLSWSYADATSYDVRLGDRAGASWRYPEAWQGLPTASVTASIAAGSGACFASRARDVAGNVSDWSEPVCQYLDGVSPTITSTSGSVAYPTVLRAPVSYNAVATDNEQVASYDVEMAVAPRNRRLGAWTRVVDAQPSARFTTGAQPPGSAICMRSRARDAAGNATGWSTARCTTAPVDDRELAKTGRTKSVSARGGIGGGYLTLLKKGSTATLSGQTGRTVGVWIRRGPHLGRADVYAGKRRIGRISFRSAATRQGLVLLRVAGGFTGNVRLVSLDKPPVHIDGIVVVR